jgi:hypothetical protein
MGASVMIPSNIDIRLEGFCSGTCQPVKIVHRFTAEIQPAFKYRDFALGIPQLKYQNPEWAVCLALPG